MKTKLPYEKQRKMAKFFLLLLFNLILISCVKPHTAQTAESGTGRFPVQEDSESSVSIEDLINNNEFSFHLLNKNGSYGGSVANEYGKWTCNFGRSYIFFQYDSHRIERDIVYVSYVTCGFNVYGTPSFRGYEYPQKETFPITKRQIEERLKDETKNEITKKVISEQATCRALVITDNLRVREAPNTKPETKIIGKLNKFDDIYLIDCTDKKDSIENLQFPWYKTRLKDGNEGWVFGGFVKIYFFDEDIQMLKEAFEKNGSEYTNQFVTPDDDLPPKNEV